MRSIRSNCPRKTRGRRSIYCGGHDFLSDGSAIVCTMQGDVWRATGLDTELDRVIWRRIASGLHQPLGVAVHDNEIYSSAATS